VAGVMICYDAGLLLDNGELGTIIDGVGDRPARRSPR
jgi:hypothetical protein